jgi:hypothetical protein
MAKNANGLAAPSRVLLNYQLIRTTTSPDEQSTGIRSYVVNMSCFEILKLGTRENLRNYLAEHNPKKRNRVHDAIRRTIETAPDRFITRNSGFVIAAFDIEVDDQKKVVRLTDASILNGAQSQGEIRQWALETFGEETPDDLGDPPFFVRAEVIVDSDAGQVVETAIARNTATPVKSISQAGARGHLDELENSIQKKFPNIKIRKKETDEDVYDTRKILQLTRLLMPVSVSKNSTPSERLRPYKNPEQCLTDFSDWYEQKELNGEARAKYDFTVQMAPFAISEYSYWESHDAWNGQHVWEETKKGGRACRRDQSGKIVWVSPGLVYPIMSAMSEFVQPSGSGMWHLAKPHLFKPAEMISKAVGQFRIMDSDPMAMGRSAGVYDALRIYPSTIMEVMKDFEEQAST